MDVNFRHRIMGGLGSYKLRGEHFETVATIILRIPGYLVLNFWWEFDLGNSVPRSLAWADVVSSGFVVFVMVQGVLLLLLPLRQLVLLYMHYLTIAVLAAADQFSRYYVSSESAMAEEWPRYEAVAFQGFSNIIVPHKPLFNGDPAESSFLRQQIAAIVFHTIVACFVTFFLDLNNNREKILLLVYHVPVFARLAGLPVDYLPVVHNFASCFVLFLTVMYIFLCLPHVFKFVRDTTTSARLMLELYGGVGLLVNVANWLLVPVQLLLFWLSLYITTLYLRLLPEERVLEDGQVVWEASDSAPLQYKALYSAAEVCHNPLLLVGTCTAVTYIARGVLSLAQVFTVGRRAFPRPQDLTQNGFTEGATMFLLSIQTSLYSMPMPDRFSLFSVILLIVLSSLVQSTYELIEPHVMALSAQGLAPLSRHVRIVTMCLFLFFLPIYMVYMFTLIFEQDFWLLLVVSTSIMTAVQVLGLFTTYCLLTYDALCAQNWPGLDDVIYYSRATTRVFEFLVAVFVVGAGIKETLAGQWSVMNIVVLIVHCYFNVFQRLQQGWKSFLLRLEAAKKISGLPQATEQQLQDYNDVCSICFSDLSSACVTSCNHLFHAPCLRKWLYVQDKCPLCQSSIAVPEVITDTYGSDGSDSNNSALNDNTNNGTVDNSLDESASSIARDPSASGPAPSVAESGCNDSEEVPRCGCAVACSGVCNCEAAASVEPRTRDHPLGGDWPQQETRTGANRCSGDASVVVERTLLPDAIEQEVGANIPMIEDSEEEEKFSEPQI